MCQYFIIADVLFLSQQLQLWQYKILRLFPRSLTHTGLELKVITVKKMEL
jgi:hypothetical protein